MSLYLINIFLAYPANAFIFLLYIASTFSSKIKFFSDNVLTSGHCSMISSCGGMGVIIDKDGI